MRTQGLNFIDMSAQRVELVPASVSRCSALWGDLMSGELEIAQAFSLRQRSALILQARPEPAPPLGVRAREVLERTLLGERRKVIAYETNISPSTLSLSLKESLASLGLRCRPSLVPSSLVILAQACLASEPLGTFIGDGEHEGRRFAVITHAFDDTVLRGLPPSERDVMRLLVSGRSNLDIAARRNSSYRTVANQIAAACFRLGVSSRFELLHRFAMRSERRARDP